MALAERDGHDLVDLLADALDLIERRAGRDERERAALDLFKCFLAKRKAEASTETTVSPSADTSNSEPMCTGRASFVETAKLVCWIMVLSVFSAIWTAYFSSTSGSSGKSAAERPMMSKSASPQVRWIKIFVCGEGHDVVGSLLKISLIRRALTTSSPDSSTSAVNFVRMPVCML